jgi:hypothetical protein
MVAEFLRQNWAWTSLCCAAGFAVALAILALLQSAKAMRASIPEPEVRAAYTEFTVIRMRPADEHRFGISHVESRKGKFLVTADMRLRELPDLVRGYLPLGRRIKSAKFDPPATSLIIRTALKGKLVRARITSRGDKCIYKWIKISL